jgi:predicted MFS family arabinose efflux permease
MRVTAVAVAALCPAFVAFLLVRDTVVSLGALALLWLLFNFFLGPAFALFQRLAGSDNRATSLALLMMLANVIGMGLGPQVVGMLSDALRPTLGVESLRYSMLSLSFVAFWAAWHLWRLGRFVGTDLETAAAW